MLTDRPFVLPILSRSHYMDAILVVLDRLRDGRARARDVGDSVRVVLGRYMTEADLGGVRSNPNDPRWWNATRWARDDLVDMGFLAPCLVSGHGVWSLTAAGRAEAQKAQARLSEPSSGAGGGGRPEWVRPGRAAQLTFLASVFRRAHETPVGSSEHQVMLDLMDTLDGLVRGGFETARMPEGRLPGTNGRTGTTATTWRAPPTPTSTLVPNTLDPARMAAFITGPWLAAINRMRSRSDAEKAARIDEVDMLASLPAVATLVAVKSGWINTAKAAELAVRSVRLVMTEHDKPGGLIGGLPLATPGDIATAIRDGLFHRVLTGWVHQLDGGGDESLALQAASVRGWLVRLRTLLGEPVGRGPRSADPLWQWLFDEDSTFEPPRAGGIEWSARELAAWLGTLPLQKGAREAPKRGTLLWHRLFGWALAAGDQQQRFDHTFSGWILSSSSLMRLGRAFETGWIDVGRATAGGGPDLAREAGDRVAAAARESWART